jgi:hypothetical protein
MSIPVLIQTYDEVRRLAIAGSVVAAGDFRLKKLVPPLEQAGQKAPVFAKVAEAAKRLVEGSEQTSATALLELAALVNSILYTQGETGVEGALTPLPSVELGRHRTQASARVLKPLQEALTSTGSGRLEIIQDGYERGAFHDLRLLAPALAALDDSYAEIADLVAEKVLPLYGPAIVPELQAKFNPKGRGGHVRRLRLMHRLDPEGTRPHVQRSLEEGSAEVRVAAISCLGDSPDDLPFLLEQAKAKAKDVRAAALTALVKCGADEAAKVLCEAISRADLELAVESLRQSRHPTVTGAVLGEADKQFNALIAGKEKDVKKLGRQNERMGLLLECLKGREDKRTEKLLLNMFEHVGPLAAVKGMPSGKDVVERLVSVMAAGPPKVQSALIDAHKTLPAETLGQAFVAARRSRKPAEVLTLFSPYLTASVNEKKKYRDPAWAKREAIKEELIGEWRWYDPDAKESSVAAPLDPRWLDLAVRLDQRDLVQALAVPGHAGASEFLSTLFREGLGKRGAEFELGQLLDTMVRVGHPGATDAVIELIKKFARAKVTYTYFGVSYWMGRLIPALPRDEALPKLEALLPTLPEKMIDELLDSVTALKQGTPTAAST